MNIKEVIAKAEGNNKPFLLTLYKNEKPAMIQKHQTYFLALTAGKNWNMLHDKNSYRIRDTRDTRKEKED